MHVHVRRGARARWCVRGGRTDDSWSAPAASQWFIRAAASVDVGYQKLFNEVLSVDAFPIIIRQKVEKLVLLHLAVLMRMGRGRLSPWEQHGR